MYSGIVIAIISILFFVFLAVYKRDMLVKVFSIDVKSSANQFQEELEEAANQAIRRMEEQISHLEYLLEEAEEKTKRLEKQVLDAERCIQAMDVAATKPPKENDTVQERTAQYQQTETATADIFSPRDRHAAFAEEGVEKTGMGNDKRRLILAMAEQGYHVTEIAKATGMGKGEIMLLLQLSKQ
jgi:Tfp pilus assembly protein PilE